jgi:hypothetical protein
LDGSIYFEAGLDSAGVSGGYLWIESGFSGKPGAITVNGGIGQAGNTTGGAASLQGGTGVGTGNGGSASVVGGSSGNGATGNGGTVSVTAGNAVSSVGDGGNVVVSAGTGNGGGTAGAVILRNAADASVTGEVTVARIQNQGGGANGGGQFDIYVADFTGAIVPPTFAASTGSLFVANSDTEASKIYQNTSIGVGTNTGVTWTEIGAGGGGTGGTATLIQTDQTLTTGSLSASGGTVDLNLTDFIDEGLIFDLQVTRTAGFFNDTATTEIYTEDTFTNRIYFAEAADASTLFRDSSGIFYEDLDTTRELHIRITNQGAAAATFDVRARAQGEGLLATNTLSFTTVKTTNYTGNSWEHIKYDPSGGTFTITFPPSPAIGDKIGTKNVTASAISITVNGNGNNLEGPLAPGTTAASVSVGGAGRSLIWQYDGTVWWVV